MLRPTIPRPMVRGLAHVQYAALPRYSAPQLSNCIHVICNAREGSMPTQTTSHRFLGGPLGHVPYSWGTPSQHLHGVYCQGDSKGSCNESLRLRGQGDKPARSTDGLLADNGPINFLGADPALSFTVMV